MTGGGPLEIGRHLRDGSIVVTPVGVLDARSHPGLRDTLLTLLAEQPTSVVVDVSGLEVEDTVVLSVFPTVAMVSAAPPVPLLLVADGHLRALLERAAVPRFVPVFPTVAAALAAALSTPVRRRCQIELPGFPSASRSARRWVRERCAEWALPDGDPLDTVVLVASELVENTIRHTRTPSRLRMEQHRSGLTVAVADGSPRPPVLRAPGPGHPVGGLSVVDALATAWGYRLDGADGKVVWAVLPFPVAPPGAGPAPRRTPAAPLRAELARAGLVADELWRRYVALGGSLSLRGLVDALSGATIPVADHDRVARALDEYVAETGDDPAAGV